MRKTSPSLDTSEAYELWRSGFQLSQSFRWLEDDAEAMELRKLLGNPAYQQSRAKAREVGVYMVLALAPLMLTSSGRSEAELILTEFLLDREKSKFGALIAHATPALRFVVAAERLAKSLKRKQLSMLQSGKHTAFGFEAPRGLDTPPKKIPIDIFLNGKIDWERDRVEVDGLSIVGVRVVEADALRGALGQKEGGRPSLRPQILGAYESLREEGAIDLTATDAEIFRVIADRLRTILPMQKGDKGFDLQTIRRHTKADLDAMRAAFKK